MRIMQPIDPTTIPNAGTSMPTVGMGQALPSGVGKNCSTIYFLNKSNVGLSLVFENGDNIIIPAWWARPVKLSDKSNQLWMSQAYTLNIPSPPISQLYMEVYGPKENADGLYNGPIVYQTSVGGNVTVITAQKVQNDNNPGATTQVIEATPQGAGASQLLLYADGHGFLGGGNIFITAQGAIEPLILAFLPALATDTTLITWIQNGPTSLHQWGLVYHTDGSWSFEDQDPVNHFVALKMLQDKSGQMSGGQITWDTSGRIGTPRVTVTDRFLWRGTLGGATQFFAELLPTDVGSKEWDFLMNADGSIQISEATDNFRAFKLATNKSGDLSAGQITWDASGNLSVPNLLEIAGQQETGHYHVQFVAPSTVAWVYWVSFRKQMTNTPSSITLSGTTLTNCTATATGITKTGFQLQLTPTAAGTVAFDGDWTTVGN